jgi:hypothetical protein
VEENMTEAEWLECEDLQKMLEFLRGKASDRKLRLFACGCARQEWHLLIDEKSQQAIVLAEQFSDGNVGVQEMESVREEAVYPASGNLLTQTYFQALQTGAAVLAYDVTRTEPEFPGQHVTWSIAVRGAIGILAGPQLLLCIFGNPFRPAALEPSCRTALIEQMARGIYDDRRFEDLPILADALEEAGCTSRDVLDHCRSPGPHVRGCWAVDLILNKG